MNYHPREGIDYLTNLYAVVDVDTSADTATIKSAIKAKLLQYHPDRLVGLAPEFQAKGERLGRLLTRANVILLDDDKRAQYDNLLDEWQGPVSKDGTPILRISDEVQYKAEQQSHEEFEASIASAERMAIDMFKYDPSRISMFETLLEAAEGEMELKLRNELDSALLAEDQVLAFTQDLRGRVAGISGESMIRIGENHTTDVIAAIESARSAKYEDNRRRALAGFDTRLALMAGEISVDEASRMIAEPMGTDLHILPRHFDTQAQKVIELSRKRQEIVDRRLELFEPTYPIEELQTTAHDDFIVGVATDKEPREFTWFRFNFNQANLHLESTDLSDGIKAMLKANDFEGVYESGNNILTFKLKEQIDHRTLLEVACNKHIKKFFPGLLKD